MEQLRLSGQRIAALLMDGFEQVEFMEPLVALKSQGATVDVVSPEDNAVRGWNNGNWGAVAPIDVSLVDADPSHYDGLLLPGGVINADHLRMNEYAQAFVRSFCDLRKPIAAICHAPWILINAAAVAGRRLTSYPSLEADLTNAGATWVDREVVIDDFLITSRRPVDLPAFNQALIDMLADGVMRTARDRPESTRNNHTAAQSASTGQLSQAPNTSFETGAGHESIGRDAADLAGNALGNSAYPEGNTYPQRRNQ